ncbi:MAG TPA: hypothetical protein VFF78_04870, partial [Anaerolineaceae bacterium]|nr:hypothetical protein [Anaerolineaceae bacterium]
MSRMHPTRKDKDKQAMQTAAASNAEKRDRRWLAVMFLLPLFALLCLGAAMALPLFGKVDMLSIRSAYSADYGVDPRVIVPNVQVALIAEALVDDPENPNSTQQITPGNLLLTPVSTVTPFVTGTPDGANTATPNQTLVTAMTGTNTPGLSPTPTPT